MKHTLCAGFALLATAPIVLAAATADRSWMSAARWSAETRPGSGPPRAIGFYAGGCLAGGVPLAPEGPGFEVLHLGRRRYFGHPALIDFVHRLAAKVFARNLPALLIGDLSQPRGGPAPSDHGSHQSGLDVDVSYTRPADRLWQSLAPEEREILRFPDVVESETLALNALWSAGIADLLELAASDPAVDRIFVSAAVKRELCTKAKPGAAWLTRLRPWREHRDHFHVRLHCPAGGRECRPQPPFPGGSGCGSELDWWFGEEARRPPSTRGRPRPLPAECQNVLR